MEQLTNIPSHLFDIEQLGFYTGNFSWRGRWLSCGPQSLNGVRKEHLDRMVIPLLEAEADGWHVWVPTPGKFWAREWSSHWPKKPIKPHFPSWQDYRRARRDTKLLWIYQFLVEQGVPEKQWKKIIKRVATKCR